MSVVNKKRLARIKGINWKKVIFWIFNIVCYIITFIFTLSLIFGSVKGSNSQNTTNSVIDYDNKPISSAIINSDFIILEPKDSRVPLDYRETALNPSLLSDTSIDLRFSDVSYVLDFDEAIDGELVYYCDYQASPLITLNVSFTPRGTFAYILSNSDGISYIYDWSSIVIHRDDSGETYDFINDELNAYYYGNPNNTIFDTIGDTIPSFVSTINDGLGETFTIFYDDGLTTIGYLTTIVVAVTLGYFALRMIMGLIRLRG